ncbi:MAG TPA: hypothetical protein VGF53_07130 [Pseudolabrys sp.]
MPRLGNLTSSWIIVPLACALVVIGAKCWMIARYGTPTPFWDQWDAEGVNLYPKYLGGTLQFPDLIAPHNEHRILVTRLWSLLLLDLGGYWDSILQMLANTLLLGSFVALLVVAFRPILDRLAWTAFALFASAIFALPFGWQSTLSSFHSQWYFLLLFSLGGLLVIVDAAALTPRWWLAVLLLILSYFSMAGGVLTAAAAFAVAALQFIVGRRSGLRELLALAILASVTVAMVLAIPATAAHAAYKPSSFGQYFQALLEILSWPAPPGRQPAIIDLLRAALMNAPVLLVGIQVIRQRPPLADRRWLLLAFAGWAALQAATIAYARSASPIASRYLDLFSIFLLLNGVCVFYLVGVYKATRQRLAVGAMALWFVVVLLGVTTHTLRYSIPQMATIGVAGRAAAENLRAYLDTNDIRVLENKPPFYIPYPDANRLATIVSQPVIRALLPPELVGEASAARAQQRGLARFTGGPIEALKNFALRWGALLIPIGLTLFFASLTMQLRREPATAPA